MATTRANIGVIVTGAPSGDNGNGATLHGLPAGGSTGSSLVKTSSVDFDAAWQPPGVEVRTHAAIVGRNANMTIPNNLTTSVIMDIVGYDPYAIAGLSNGGDPRAIYLTPGFWMFEMRLEWSQNGTGTRGIAVTFGGTSIPLVNSSAISGDHFTRISNSNYRDITTEPLIRLGAFQDSGAPLALTLAHLSAVRIGGV